MNIDFLAFEFFFSLSNNWKKSTRLYYDHIRAMSSGVGQVFELKNNIF